MLRDMRSQCECGRELNIAVRDSGSESYFFASGPNDIRNINQDETVWMCAKCGRTYGLSEADKDQLRSLF